MRKSTLFLSVLASQMLLVGFTAIHAAHTRATDGPAEAEKKRMVRDLAITDLCLFTEASYTRHLSQADIHTPFQDHPFSLEHFPTGSLFAPPMTVTRNHGKVD